MMSDKPEPPPSDSKTQRAIRVFISSTFRDMHEERNYLVTHIFPQLRKLCDQRGVVWGEVDLRWGINEEQKAEGKVLPICLEEIKRCQPYFIGLLGERYGWLQNEIPQELLKEQPWLKEHIGKSVTELEILQGVLRNPDMAEHAFFYFRDPAYIKTIPPDKQKDFTAEGTEDAEKLKRLKEQIRKSGFPVRENYPNPKALGELVLKDMKDVIEKLFPEGSQPDPLDREAYEHEIFARSRTVREVRAGEFRGVYIGRDEYFKILDEHARGNGQPLVVIGESGSGKSALLANWALQYKQKHPDELLVMHFVGSTPYSADWMAMLRRIMEELKRKFNIQGEIPDKPDALRMAFANWLHMASVKGRAVLILDALNQLEDRDGAPDLVWLPPVIPPNIRLILSTLTEKAKKNFTAENAEEQADKKREFTAEGAKGADEQTEKEKEDTTKEEVWRRPWEALKTRGWHTLTVEPLNQDERRIFIEKYLAQYTKSLSPDQARSIASAGQTQNPLYLRTLLEELRIYGDYETLGKKIDYYLEARNPYELYTKVLIRWEEAYEGDSDLVGDSMSLIWASRRGLTETELLGLLGKDNEPLPRAVWSPLYLAAEESLVNRSGLLNFFHDYLRDAVRDTYIPTDELQKETHLRLADYFNTLELFPLSKGGEGVVPNSRKMDELLWQLAQAKAWERLYNLLVNIPFYQELWDVSIGVLMGYWSQVEENSVYRVVDAYRPILEKPTKYYDYVIWLVTEIFSNTGKTKEAMRLLEYQVDYYLKNKDIKKYTKSIIEQAIILKFCCDLKGATKLFKKAEINCRKLRDNSNLRVCLGNQALILQELGELEEAMKFHKEEENICHEHGDKHGLQISLGNQALILLAWGKLEEAMKLRRKQEFICKEFGYKDFLAISLGEQANIFKVSGDLVAAMEIHKKEEHIFRELGVKDGLSVSIGNQAAILEEWGRLDEAMVLFKEQERITRELGDIKGLAISLANQAGLLFKNIHKINEVNEAQVLAEEAYTIANTHGLKTLAQKLRPIYDLAQQIKPIVDTIKHTGSSSRKEAVKKQPQYAANGNIICPNCSMESKKGTTFCVWCKTWFK